MNNTLLTLRPPPGLTRHWQLTVNRADSGMVAMYKRHYSCYEYKDGRVRTQAVKPGRYIALMTANRDALFIWSKPMFRRDGQTGVECAVFRNEGNTLSSTLITEAMDVAWQRWPGERLFTFVNASKIRSVNPGYCFKRAGWKRCGESTSGLIVLEIWPPETVQLEMFER